MIEFDLEKHFTAILRTLLVVSVFCAIFGFFASTDIFTDANQITFTTYHANELIGNLMYSIFGILVGLIILTLGVSVLKVSRTELNEWKKLHKGKN